MQNTEYTYVGIDVSKETLDVFLDGKYRRIGNNAKDLRKFCQELAAMNREGPVPFVVVEATGKYHQDLTVALHTADVVYSQLNPRQVRDFARARGLLAKTDKIDARMLADLGKTMRPDPSQLTSEAHRRLFELATRRDSLTTDRVREGNRLEACRDDFVRREIKAHLKFLEKSVARLESEIEQLLEENAELHQKREVLIETKGVGPKISVALLAYVPELGNLSRNEAAALVGLAPLNCDSGKSRGKRRTWGGRAKARKSLFQGAVVAKRHNSHLREVYERHRAAGKPKKVALVAVARKLLIHLNSRLKHPQGSPSTKPAKPEPKRRGRPRKVELVAA
jgi:transposase